MNRGTFSSRAIWVFVFLFFGSFGAYLLTDYPFTDYFKYFLPLFLIYFSLFHLLRVFPVQPIFELYVEMAVWTAVFGILQLGLKVFLGIKLLSVYSAFAIDSVAGEPSHYAVIIMPAVIYCVLNRRRYKLKALVLTLAMLFTFKVSAYFTFAFVMVIAYVNGPYLFILGASVVWIYIQFILTNEGFTERIFPLVDYFFRGKLLPPEEIHGTSLSFISNFEVAKYSLSKNPFFGVGIGGHEHAYYEYYRFKPFIGIDYYFGLNSRSAHSLLIRILSETGIIGFIFYIFTLLRSVIIKKDLLIYRAISLACISHFVGKSLKLGSYIDYGTPVFFIILILNAAEYRRVKLNCKVS